MIWSEHFPGILGRFVEDNDHESAHQEGCICLLRVVQACIVVNLVCAVLLIVDELFKLLAEKVNFTEIQRSKVSEKRLIHQIVVYAEVERVSSRLWRILVRDPVQALWNDLNRFVVAVQGCLAFCCAGIHNIDFS